MNAIDTTVDALAKLKMHEQAIGRLYKTYAERFPQQAEFWSKLSRDEYLHAKWIDTLEAETRDDPASLVTKRFPVAAIEHSLTFIEKLIAEADEPDFTPVNAISAARNLEQALLENKYFEVFETDTAKMKRILTRLRQETRSHRALVQEVWEATQRNGEPQVHSGPAITHSPGPGYLSHTRHR